MAQLIAAAARAVDEVRVMLAEGWLAGVEPG
jgi:hypothetical protein